MLPGKVIYVPPQFSFGLLDFLHRLHFVIYAIFLWGHYQSFTPVFDQNSFPFARMLFFMEATISKG